MTNCAHSKYSGRSEARASIPFHNNYENNNNTKRFYIENSPLDGTVQSSQFVILKQAGYNNRL